MNTKRTAASVVALGTIVGSIVGLRSVVVGTPSVAHAASITPAVTMSAVQLNPLSVDFSGTRFTSGGAVHADLVVAYWSDCTSTGSGSSASPSLVPTHTPGNQTAPRIVASGDTQAARTVNVPNGHGIVFTKQGGYFSAALTSPVPTLGGFSYWVVVTDKSTGSAVSTYATGAVTTAATCR